MASPNHSQLMARGKIKVLPGHRSEPQIDISSHKADQMLDSVQRNVCLCFDPHQVYVNTDEMNGLSSEN